LEIKNTVLSENYLHKKQAEHAVSDEPDGFKALLGLKDKGDWNVE
jgi:hypothetical protein